jgi:N-acetylmuramoyl-L-alanine amidase
MSLIVKGHRVDVPGLKTKSWLDDPAMHAAMPSDGRARRTEWIRSLVLHTTQGDEPQEVLAGFGPEGMAKRTAESWAGDKRHAAAHLIVDGDGTVWCLADLQLDVTFHATSLNEVSIGIEIAQTRALAIYEVQLDATVLLCDALTRLFRIQRQFHAPYLGDSQCVKRLADGGSDCIGVFGHRDQTTDRGRGDPGDAIFRRLRGAGYEAFNFATGEDLAVWRFRQLDARANPDGIPGPSTATRLAAGHPHGLWIGRPGD